MGNGINNVRLLRAASAEIEDGVARSCDAVLVDPPRAGLDNETRNYVAAFDHIIYISCNPVALVNDLRFLGSSFEVVSLAFFDMFPYTTHAECAVRVRRRSRAGERWLWLRDARVILPLQKIGLKLFPQSFSIRMLVVASVTSVACSLACMLARSQLTKNIVQCR